MHTVEIPQIGEVEQKYKAARTHETILSNPRTSDLDFKNSLYAYALLALNFGASMITLTLALENRQSFLEVVSRERVGR